MATKSVNTNHMKVQRESSNYPLVRILNRKANKVTSQTTQTCNSIRSLHNDRLLGIITCMLMGVQYGEAFAQVCAEPMVGEVLHNGAMPYHIALPPVQFVIYFTT